MAAAFKPLLAAAAAACCCAAASSGHTYKYAAGTVPVGDDVIPPANLTLALAEAKCSSLPACVGLTFKAGSPTPTGTVKVYFKDVL